MIMFQKKVGDRIIIDDDGVSGIRLRIRDGWNDSCDWHTNRLSIEELRDLQYVIGRVIDNRMGR